MANEHLKNINEIEKYKKLNMTKHKLKYTKNEHDRTQNKHEHY